MNPWAESLTAALHAVPPDVDTKAVRKVVNQWAKQRQPAKEVSPHAKLIDLWCKAFMDWFKCEYVFQAKDAAAVKKLLGHFEVEHVMRIATAAWKHKDTYPCSMSLTLPKLLSHINEIREWLNANRNGTKAKGFTTIPAFKQLEIVKASIASHPCNPRSIFYDPDASYLKGDYTELKRKLQSLEQEQRKRVVG